MDSSKKVCDSEHQLFFEINEEHKVYCAKILIFC